MRILLVTIMIGLAAVPALAQKGRNTEQTEEQRQKDEEKRRKAREVDKSYKGALETIPERKKSADPWGGVR